jgi:tetratricopeptide (TPR) repeat protein
MVGLMDLLRRQHREKPSSIELMFATHPMSDERYQTAVNTARDRYPDAANLPLYRERFMDQTARLRTRKKAIETLQAGEKQLYQKQFGAAEELFRQALQAAPDDYAGLVLMAKCQLLQKKTAEGLRYAQRAQQVYPQEAQAHHLSGFARLQQKEYADSFQDFNTYQRLMPLDPNTAFFKGYCQEGMQNRPAAAQEYHRYLQTIRQGQYAQHAYRRMVEWGYYTQ